MTETTTAATTRAQWDTLRGPGLSEAITPRKDTMIDLYLEVAAERRDAVAIEYHGSELTYLELTELSRGFAAHLVQDGVRPGDLVAIYLQSSPSFVVSVLGTWLAGATAVPINPMYREREMRVVLEDSGATVVVTSESGRDDVVAKAIDGTAVRTVVSSCELDFQERDDPRVFGDLDRRPDPNVDDLLTVSRAADSANFQPVPVNPDTPAFLCFTSGTTGTPKAAVLTQEIVVRNAENIRAWQHLGPDDRFYALAPLFHVTGLVAELAICLAAGGTLVLPYRFVPTVALETFVRVRPTFMVGPATAYTALRTAEGASAEHFTSFTTVLHGGTMLPSSVAEEFEERFGVRLSNGYGLTETAGPAVSVPDGWRGRVDPATSAVSIGVPFPGIDLLVIDDEGRPLPPGESGQIALRGPTVISSYWRRPEATTHAIVDGWFRTGDVGFVDDEGWVYVIDRIKDMIIAGGFKVWPGEVEQVLYAHPGVAEAAVIGVPDEYRGETVKAFVTLRDGQDTSVEDLVAWCRERMAAYKYPRVIDLVDHLPRNQSGKIERRILRDAAWSRSAR